MFFSNYKELSSKNTEKYQPRVDIPKKERDDLYRNVSFRIVHVTPCALGRRSDFGISMVLYEGGVLGCLGHTVLALLDQLDSDDRCIA